MSDMSPSTWWSGRSHPTVLGEPEVSRDDQLTKAIIAGSVIVAIPVALLVVVAVGWVSVWRRASYLWSVGVAAAGAIWVVADGGVKASMHRAYGAYPVLIHTAFAHVPPLKLGTVAKHSKHLHQAVVTTQTVKGDLLHLLWVGTPTGLALGGVLSTIYVGIVARRRAHTPWLDQERAHVTIADRLRLRSNPAKVAACIDAPETGTVLGIDPKNGEQVDVDAVSLGAHVLIPGASGSGKTTTAMRLLHGAIRHGYPVVTIDLKASVDVASTLEAYANRYGRPFYRWSLTGPTYYDPLTSGDPSRRRDLLLGTMDFTEPLYRDIAANYLQFAFTAMDAVPPKDPERSALSDLVELLSMRKLTERVQPYSEELPKLFAQITQMVEDTDTTQRSGVRGLAVRLSKTLNSTAGEWLGTPIAGGQLLDLRAALREGAVVCFSLDSSNYEEIASTVASLIIQDLKTLSSEMRTAGNKTPAHVFVDEFAAIESVNILGLLNKARDACMPVILATQTLADLARQEPTFVDQVLDIVGTFVVHRTNTFEASERLALLAGQTAGYRVSHTVEAYNSIALAGGKMGAGTGRQTIDQLPVRRLEASAIQELQPGYAYLLCKARPGDEQLRHVRVIPADAGADTSPVHPSQAVVIGASAPRPEPVGREGDRANHQDDAAQAGPPPTTVLAAAPPVTVVHAAAQREAAAEPAAQPQAVSETAAQPEALPEPTPLPRFRPQRTTPDLVPVGHTQPAALPPLPSQDVQEAASSADADDEGNVAAGIATNIVATARSMAKSRPAR